MEGFRISLAEFFDDVFAYFVAVLADGRNSRPTRRRNYRLKAVLSTDFTGMIFETVPKNRLTAFSGERRRD